jgi:PAS domain S-box-containing protein
LVRSTAQGDQIFLLKGSDQPYRNLIEEMNEGALLLSETGTILYCNDGFARLVDAPLEGIMGSNIRDWVHPNSILVFDVFSSNPVTEKRVFEATLKTTKQKPIATLVSVNKISIDSINALALIVTDLTNHMEEEVRRYTVNLEKEITERGRVEEALRESEGKYRSLFNSIDEGFCIIEMVFDFTCKPTDYRILEVNYMYEKQTGIHNPVGKLIRSIVPDLEEYWFTIYGEIALSGQPKRFENESKAMNHYYDVYAFPIGEKRPYRLGVLFKDIAERKKAEDELKQAQAKLQEHANNLEGLVEERTKKLQDAQRLAAIGQVAGMVGHDIRNPLQAIVGELYFAKESMKELPTVPKEAIESLDFIQEQTD